MKVSELIAHLSIYPGDVEVKVGMWYGPGSPSITPYPLQEFRLIGQSDYEPDRPGEVYICASDLDRGPRVEPDRARMDAARDLECLARRLTDEAHWLRVAAKGK